MQEVAHLLARPSEPHVPQRPSEVMQRLPIGMAPPEPDRDVGANEA